MPSSDLLPSTYGSTKEAGKYLPLCGQVTGAGWKKADSNF